MKRPKNEMYILNEDIEKLHERYEALFKQVKSSSWLPPTQVDHECEVLQQKYDFEIEELSLYREAEYWERRAKIKAKKAWKKPWRRCWLWRLLFQPLTNRAQDIIEEQAEWDAEDYFAPLEKELDARLQHLKELQKKLKTENAIEVTLQQADATPPAEILGPTELQATQTNTNAATAGAKPSPKPSTAATAAPMSEPTPLSDKRPHSDNVADSPASEQQEKPKRGRKPKQPAADVVESPAPSPAPKAIPGQIDINELVQNK